MRTFLTRLTFSATGVVLTGVGMAAAAYASDDDLTIIDESPIYVGETPSLPPVDECEVEYTIEDCGPSVEVDDGLLPLHPDGAELIDPGSLGDDGSESGDDTSDEPEDGGSEGSEGEGADTPSGSESTGESASGEAEESTGEPGTTEDESDTDHGGPGAPDESSGDSGDGGGDTGSDGSGEPASEDAAEPTPESDKTTVTPATQSASNDGGGTSDLLLVVLVGALAAFGLGMIGTGLVRSTQPAHNRRP